MGFKGAAAGAHEVRADVDDLSPISSTALDESAVLRARSRGDSGDRLDIHDSGMPRRARALRAQQKIAPRCAGGSREIPPA